MTESLRIRRAVRALVIDNNDQVLLVKYETPLNGTGDSLSVAWGVPGGGIDDGESEIDGLRRELFEELGLVVTERGPALWHRSFDLTFLDPEWDIQEDTCYLLRVDSFTPEPAIGWQQMNAEYVTELRWWTLSELKEATEVRFAPRGLADLVGAFISGGPPEVPPLVR